MSGPLEPAPIQLEPTIANVIALYARADTLVPGLNLADVQELRGAQFTPGSSPRGSLRVADSGEAILCLEGEFYEPGDRMHPALEAKLTDGSSIRTGHAYFMHRHTSLPAGQPAKATTEFKLSEWSWLTKTEPVAWVCVLRGVDFTHASNLRIRGLGVETIDALRLEGNFAWHLLRKGVSGKQTCVAVIDAKRKDVDRSALRHDFAALEFLFGTPLRLDALVGVNERNEAVAAFGASFGYRFYRTAVRAPPLPDSRDGAWIAVAFPLVSAALHDGSKNATTRGVCGYVDSTLGHVDGQYLFAQIALEAVAAQLTTSTKPVVKDVAAWKAWTKTLRSDLEHHAADPAAVNVLATKLRDAAMPTTSRLVKQLLEELAVTAPDEGLKEIEGRNIVAHTFSMTDGKPYDVDRDVRRIRIIRTLLAAVLLRSLGYEGALAGWDRDEYGWPVPADWFPPSEAALARARQCYHAIASAAEPTTPEQEASA